MLARNALGFCATLVLFAACGGSGGTATTGSHMGGSGTGASGTGASGTSSSSGTGATGTTSSSGTMSSSSSSTSSGAATCSGPGYTVTGSIFKVSEPWNTAVDQDPVDPQSSTIIGWLAGAGGWGNGNVLQIDTSITVLCADASTPMKPFTGGPGVTDPSFCGPDCDVGHTTFPVPNGGAIEGESGYACNSGGDCHMLVVDVSHNWLWEMYGAFNPADPANFYSVGGATIWDLNHAYGPSLRGDGCTSADAGGFPIAAMLFSADEVAAGSIDHAIRFVLPGSRVRRDAYVHPATHGAGSGPAEAVPFGTRWRLRRDYDLGALGSEGARVVARALQRYGMFLADRGSVTLTARRDRSTAAKWSGLLGARDLDALQPSDFEIVEAGERIPLTRDCVRNP